MNFEGNIDLDSYNSFCGNLREGYILYNIDSTNQWGDYLLVANVATVRVKGIETYTCMLLGLKKEDNRFVPRNCRIKLTPDYAGNIPFLKYVGKCDFTIVPVVENVEVNLGLVTVYGTIDLHKFAEKLSIRKPRNRKYGRDGKPVIKKNGN